MNISNADRIMEMPDLHTCFWNKFQVRILFVLDTSAYMVHKLISKGPRIYFCFEKYCVWNLLIISKSKKILCLFVTLFPFEIWSHRFFLIEHPVYFTFLGYLKRIKKIFCDSSCYDIFTFSNASWFEDNAKIVCAFQYVCLPLYL